MDEKKYLDKGGVEKLWAKIKAYISSNSSSGSGTTSGDYLPLAGGQMNDGAAISMRIPANTDDSYQEGGLCVYYDYNTTDVNRCIRLGSDGLVVDIAYSDGGEGSIGIGEVVDGFPTYIRAHYEANLDDANNRAFTTDGRTAVLPTMHKYVGTKLTANSQYTFDIDNSTYKK